MAITKDSKRAEYGDHLRRYSTEGTRACGVLSGIKTNLANLKTSMQADPDFDQADVDEVTAIQTALRDEIQAIIS